MNIIRHDPWALFNQFNELSKILDKRISSNEDNSTVETSHWAPAVDIKEEPSRFVLYADIPGVEPKDIEIAMENGVLTIKGERCSETKQEEGDYTRIERRTGTFYRRFALPDTADADAISAHGKHGVLEVIIPKREKAKARKIEVAVKN
jgi:HSP20 family protein